MRNRSADLHIPWQDRLWFRASALAVVLITGMQGIFAFLLIQTDYSGWQHEQASRRDALINGVARKIPAPLQQGNQAQVENLLRSLLGDDILAAAIRTGDNRYLCVVRQQPEVRHAETGSGCDHTSQAINLQNTATVSSAQLLITEDHSTIDHLLLADIGRRILEILAVDLLLIIAQVVALQRYVIRPLCKMRDALQAAAFSNTEIHFPNLGRQTEFSILESGFSAIVQRLQADLDRMAESERIARERQASAERALDQLKEAHEALTESERLASLGALVAGIAHEVNTPLGNIVTTTSLARDKLQTQLALLQNPEGSGIKRSQIIEEISLSLDAINLAFRNADRAAELIRSFKQVAVDQCSDALRHLSLGEYVAEVLKALSPLLRKHRIDFSIDCPQEILLDSYPGLIAQIVTNLVTNVLLHAYEANQSGWCRLAVTEEDDQIAIEARDGGKGIPASYLERIFDPFFTTKRGSGGSGLGLSIVHGIVVSKLGGAVTAYNHEEGGAVIRVSFPRQMPAA